MAFFSQGVGVEVAGLFFPPSHVEAETLCRDDLQQSLSTRWTRHRRVERQLSSRV